MSTQTQLPSLAEAQHQIQDQKSLLDEPWKVVVLPEEPKLPPGVWPAPDPHEAKNLPWRRGDVTRLKDDSPKGMMEYIATHSTGWWREMAERALRDTEKAERMAREQGWQYGQYWALEVDAEAKQKLLDAEEAKRAREEAARAKEVAEKEAFVKRQMELLEKAGRAPRCEYQYTDGRGCRAPQVKGERWCHGHAKTMGYRPEKLEILPMEDEKAVMVNLYRVTQSLLSGRITEKVAGLTLWSIAIGMPSARKLSPQRARRTERENNVHRGGTETRRKTKNHSPQIHGKPGQVNADGRGSERKVGRESRHAGTRSTRKSANQVEQRGVVHAGTPPRHAKCVRAGDPGVTNDKSFVSGVTPGKGPSGDPVRKAKTHRRGRPSTPSSQNRASRGTRRCHTGMEIARHRKDEPQRARRHTKAHNGRQSGSVLRERG